jgi:hypothetical protein
MDNDLEILRDWLGKYKSAELKETISRYVSISADLKINQEKLGEVIETYYPEHLEYYRKLMMLL